MKRFWTVLLTVLLAVCCLTVTVSAEASFVYVTDAAYMEIRSIGKDNTMIYTAMDGSDFVMGALTEEGEISRETYSADGWDAMVKESVWTTTVHGTAAALCPYASTHSDATVCPYLDVIDVTMTNTQTGVALEHYYIPKIAASLLPDGAVHFCWGRYNFVSPLSLKWDGESRYFALKNADGKWGVFDSETDTMATAYLYENMSEIYGSYAKVSDGTAFGRLDLTGTFETAYTYETEDGFSVKEELRQIADGQWQVFTKDNEAVSVVFPSADTVFSYEAASHLVLATYADGTSALLDLNGDTVATFDSTRKAAFLQDSCYAVTHYTESGTVSGIALARADDVIAPSDTVLKGDVDLNSLVNSRDCRLMLRHISKERPLTELKVTAGDMDDSGELETLDVRTLMRLIVTEQI